MSDVSPDEPIHIWLVVYDLLPPGRLSSLAFILGVGIYHTSIRIDGVGQEYAFGGHPYPQLSGVFSTAVKEDRTPPLPGLRWLKDIDMGEVRLSDRSDTLRRERSRSGSKDSHEYPPHLDQQDASASDSDLSTSDEDGGASSGLAKLPPKASSDPRLRRVHRVLSRLQRSSSWRGTSYDLLNHNCNSFTDTLCRRLTGRGIPGWCNRAASVGTMLPCLVPAEWVEPPEAPATPNTTATYQHVRQMV